MATSKSQVCNLSLSRLGNYGSISDIDTPENSQELVFAKWYDTTRQKVLKHMIPNFATRRIIVAQLSVAPVFGYAYAYEYPNSCLKVLGIGEIQEKENDYAIETSQAGIRQIMTDDEGASGLNIRYIHDEKDVTKFTDDFVTLMSWELAANVCMEITQDLERLVLLEKLLPTKRAATGAVDSQENMPVRINRSKFQKARVQTNPTITDKK